MWAIDWMQSYFYFHISICHDSCFIKAVYMISGKAVKEHWFLQLPWIPSNTFSFYDVIIFYNSVLIYFVFMTVASSSSSQPRIVTKPWQKGLSGLDARIALFVTTVKRQAKVDYWHVLLVSWNQGTLGDDVSMSHSRRSYLPLEQIFSLCSCQEISLPFTFSVMQDNWLSRCLFPLQTQARSLWLWISISLDKN